MTTPRRGPLSRPGLTFAALAAFLVLIGLGVWQIQRLRWKTALLAEIAEAQRAPAQPLNEALAEIRKGQPVGWRRVIANCPGLEHGGAAELHAIQDGVLGRRWISPCLIEGGPYGAILVDRGFVPQGAVPPPSLESRTHRPVVGFLRAAEPPGRFAPPSSRVEVGGGVWYARDLPRMAAGLTNVAPVFLMLESPPPASGLPRPAPLPTEIPNNHLGYALTWFGLAAALLAVYGAMMFKRPPAIPSE